MALGTVSDLSPHCNADGPVSGGEWQAVPQLNSAGRVPMAGGRGGCPPCPATRVSRRHSAARLWRGVLARLVSICVRVCPALRVPPTPTCLRMCVRGQRGDNSLCLAVLTLLCR